MQHVTTANTSWDGLEKYWYHTSNWEWTIENKPRKRTTDRDCVTTKKKKKNSFAPKTPMMDHQNCSSYRQYPRLTRKNHSRATALLRLQNEQRFLWPRWRMDYSQSKQTPSNDTIASKKQKSQSAHNTPQNSPAATTMQIEGTVPTMMLLLAG